MYPPRTRKPSPSPIQTYATNGCGLIVQVIGINSNAAERARPSAAIGTRMAWRAANDTGSRATSTSRGSGAQETSIGVEAGLRKTAQVWSGDSDATMIR